MRIVELRSPLFFFPNCLFISSLSFMWNCARQILNVPVCATFFFSSSTRERLTRHRVQPIAECRHQKARTNADYDLVFSRLTVCGFAKMAVNDLVCCVVVAEIWD